MPPGRLRPARAGRADARACSAARCRSSTSPTQTPCPYARSLLFGYVAQFVYEGDSPIAERRAAALSLDQGLLAELLGRAELRELLDPEVLAEVEAELQRLAPDRRARDAEGGRRPAAAARPAHSRRGRGPLGRRRRRREWLADPRPTRAAWSRPGSPARSAGRRSRTSGGCATASACPSRPAPPTSSPSRIEDPLGDLIARYARTHGPFTTAEVAARLGLGEAVARHALQRLVARGRVLEGEFRPSGSGSEWCDAEVLRKLRRRSLARLRKEVEPVDPDTVARFLPAWQHVGRGGQAARRRRRGRGHRPARRAARCRPVALEPLVLAARVRDYEPSLPRRAHRLRRGRVGRPLPAARQRRLGQRCTSPTRPHAHPARRRDHRAQRRRARVLEALDPGGAWFFRQLSDRVGSTSDARALRGALVPGVAGPADQRHRHPAAGTGALRQRQPPHPPHPAAAARQRPDGHRPDAVRTGPPETAGRWALLPERDSDPTRRAHATAEHLLERHGVVTRGAVMSERVPGGFAGVYKVLSRLRGHRSVSPRLLHRGPRGGAVRLRRSRSTGCAPSATPTPSPAVTRSRDAGHPSPRPPWPNPLRRGAAVARTAAKAASGGRPATGRAARPGPWWCWSTAT